ncbi:30S ribosomal protein S1 [Aquisphaera giovannonii]|uniref:30S ribosomal protein S1 n=1 Tax=Aquisphaera giovannonii TaxID=406548 RepID=A0A5B9WA75_9BACT|nr:S1 RNA-binding domain-containing protein [Aquisphaera giovannonii]QEH36995.1 30S ribosomal protein S1 [Aquisphaera giovannonii]
MADQNPSPRPDHAHGSKPSSPIRPGPPPDAEESLLDEVLDKAMGEVAGAGPRQEVSLKRQWDDQLEAELEAALAGFDPKSIDPRRERPKRAEKPADDKSKPGERDRSHSHDARKAVRTGRVIGARGKSLFIDLGGKSEGVIPIGSFEGEIPVPGSTIEVVFDHYDPSEGIQHLRLKGSAIEANWDNLREGVVVEGRGTKAVKGGLEVDVDGIRAFMPISQIDLNRVESAADYVNQKLKAIVTEVNSREKNLVISRRELLEQERAELREKTWATLEVNQTREGVVRSVKDFGAFVDIGGVDGLLPIGEMSWSRVQKVEDLIKTGDKVTVKVLKIDPVTRKLTLGLKQLMPSPWEGVEQKYPRGLMVNGKVTKLMEFGAFVELEPGVEGLIHVTELSPTRVRKISDIVKPEQEVEVRILKVEPDLKRISLSLLPAKGKDAPKADEPEEEDEPETPPIPKPERKVPLKGGLGDKDRGLFG